MKILLLGEYSGFHTTLRDGLRAIGHDALVVGTGDGAKAIPVDWRIGTGGPGIFSKLDRIVRAVHFCASMPDVNVVQLINPHVFPRGFGLNSRLMHLVRRKVPKLFLSACGDDAFFVQKAIKQMRYNPIDDAVIYDFNAERHPLDSPFEMQWNCEIADMVDGIIPVMHEYELGYRHHRKVLPTIPLPINVDDIQYNDNKVRGKILVLHGAGRVGFKGSKYIMEAFDVLDKKHPGVFEFLHVGNMPIDKYLELMKRVNIVVDQTSSYSCGMNALIALAMGKVVLGGSEPESLLKYGGVESPVINITPDSARITFAIERLLDKQGDFQQLGFEGRKFVELNHDYVDIALRYVDAWGS